MKILLVVNIILFFVSLPSFSGEVLNNKYLGGETGATNPGALENFYETRQPTKENGKIDHADLNKKWEFSLLYTDASINMKDMNDLIARHKSVYATRGDSFNELQSYGGYFGYNLWKRFMSFGLEYHYSSAQQDTTGTIGAFTYKFDEQIILLKFKYDLLTYRRFFLSAHVGPGYLWSSQKVQSTLGKYEFSGETYGYQAELSAGLYFLSLFSLRLSYLYNQFVINQNIIDSSSGIILGLNQGSSGKELEKIDNSNFTSDFSGSGFRASLSYIF